MKKILIFSTAYLPLIGGAEIAVKEITDRLPDFNFDMMTARMDKKLSRFEKVGKISIYRVGWGLGALDKFLLPFFCFLKAVKLYKKNRYDLAWSIMASQASVAAAFFKICNPKIPLILTLQEGDEERHLERYVFGSAFLYNLLIRPWHLLVFKCADYITAISKSLAERARKNKVRCPIEIIPNGVDIKKFQTVFQDSQLNELRGKLYIKEGERILIHTGRFAKKNALDDLIKSLKFLSDDVKILLVGEGAEETTLKNLAEELGVEKRVIFVKQQSHAELPKFIKISDIFIRPSLSEGLGNSFLEAMAASLPIIGTPVGGIPDFLVDGQTGLFCEVKNPESIAEKVKLLLEDNELRQRVVKNAKELIEKKYDWNLIAEEMRNIFYKLTVNS